MPSLLETTELTFLLHLIRVATKEWIIPKKIVLQNETRNQKLIEYWGCNPKCGEQCILVISQDDAVKPFVSENESIWEYFEPELRRRLSELELDESVARI